MRKIEKIIFNASNKAQEAINRVDDIGNKSSVTLNHQFADNTARDTYFTANPTELVEKAFIKVGTGYQQYINGAWEDTSAVIIEQPNANQMGIVDAGNLYNNTDVEGALQEVKGDLDEHKLDYTEHLNSTMPHKIENLKTGKTYRYGYQISADGIPQIISEEVI